MTLKVELLPAKEGDSIWITYGDPSKHILIDGGRSSTADTLKEKLSQTDNPMELVVVTHVDRDHIEGLLKILQDNRSNIACKDFWFNSYEHLNNTQLIIEANYENAPPEIMGPRQGEELSDAIVLRGLPWNKIVLGKPIECPTKGPGDKIKLSDDLSLQLISPDRDKLEALIPKWKKECRRANILPGFVPLEHPDTEVMGPISIDNLAEEPFEDDESLANGTSIAFLLEHDNKRILFAGDAHVDKLIAALDPLANGGKVKLNAFKVPHHGSRHNISKELLALIDCDNYLMSTNGSYFNHPDPVAISRIIKYGGDNVNLWFNYKSPETLLWDTDSWKQDNGYHTHYPPDTDGVLPLEL